MGDIKQTFKDIFFEPDETETQEEKPVKNQKSSVSSDSPIKAKDILYRKSKGSAFINLNEPVKFSNGSNSKEDNNDIGFEFSQQISPIFGVIKENKKKAVNYNKDIIDTQTSRPETSHLNIITSPIYGYGSKEEAMAGNYDVKGINDSSVDEQLHSVFEKEDNFLEQSFNSIDEDFTDEIVDDDFNFYNSFGDQK